MSTIFREPAPVKTPAAEPEKNIYGHDENPEDIRPVENEQDILDALGVEENAKTLPTEDHEDLQEFKDYLDSYLEKVGLPKTLKGVKKGLERLKEEVGLDEEADPQTVIKRIGGVARSWKELSFIQDVDERRKILMRVARASTPKEMDRIVFEEMNKKKIWQ